MYEGHGVDFHLYGGLSEDSGHFPPHNDLATNYIIQLDGECHWTIYNEQATYDEETESWDEFPGYPRD
jgi:ribosomal protein L16 Arg81 hydroxylase